MNSDILKKIDSFFTEFKQVKFKKGEIILGCGDQISGIYYLKKGFVKQYSISEDGEEVTINIFRPPSFFPIMLALGNVSNRYYFEAIADVETWRSPVKRVLSFITKEPDVLFDLTKRFASAINGLAQRIENLSVEQAYKRVISLLLYLAKTFGETRGTKIIINLPITHNNMATWVNLSRETVSREIEKLIEKGLISQSNRRLIIENLEKIKKEQ